LFVYFLLTTWALSQGGVVGIATELRAGLSGDRIPVGAKYFSLENVQTGFGVHPNLLYSGYRGYFPEGKAVGA
jgi:hypothetical protein